MMLTWLFSSMWGWLSLTTIVLLGCGVVAYLFPPFRRLALEVAAVVLAAATIYAKGSRDEKRKWDEAEKNMVKKSKEARAAAELDVSRDTPSVLNADKFNRDRS